MKPSRAHTRIFFEVGLFILVQLLCPSDQSSHGEPLVQQAVATTPSQLLQLRRGIESLDPLISKQNVETSPIPRIRGACVDRFVYLANANCSLESQALFVLWRTLRSANPHNLLAIRARHPGRSDPMRLLSIQARCVEPPIRPKHYSWRTTLRTQCPGLYKRAARHGSIRLFQCGITGHGFNPVAHVQFLANALDVSAHGFAANAHLVGDFFVNIAGGQQLQRLPFPW